jgi:acyl-CoA synthetase (AMP-forming)/AMP-acid ligase II
VSFTTLDQVLPRYAAECPEKIAMRADDRTWTYAALRDEAARVAQALLAEAVAPQERVAFLDRNVPEFFPFLFGAAMADAVTLAVNWRLAPREMEYILNHSQSRVLLIGEEFLDHLAQMNLETVKRIVVVGRGGAHVAYSDWIEGHEPIDPEVPCRPEETCFQLYTSGTTGLPKGVELTHSNLLCAMHIGARMVDRPRLGLPGRDAPLPHRGERLGDRRVLPGGRERPRSRARSRSRLAVDRAASCHEFALRPRRAPDSVDPARRREGRFQFAT